MQFKPEMIEAIKLGRKTQTRRPVKPGDRITGIGSFDDNGEVVERVYDVASGNGRSRWRIYGCYSICPGRGKNRVGLIRITDIRRQVLYEISEADARAEGFENRDAFLASWKSLYPKSDLTEQVWVLEFKLA